MMTVVKMVVMVTVMAMNVGENCNRPARRDLTHRTGLEWDKREG